jgi:hypothetical protein
MKTTTIAMIHQLLWVGHVEKHESTNNTNNHIKKQGSCKYSYV